MHCVGRNVSSDFIFVTHYIVSDAELTFGYMLEAEDLMAVDRGVQAERPCNNYLITRGKITVSPMINHASCPARCK